MKSHFDQLVPELQRWDNGQGIDISAWITCVGNFEHLIGYIELIWPEFVLHDGCVLAAGFSKESYLGFLESTRGCKQSVEAVINHLHLLDLFGDPQIVPTADQLVHIGRKLQQIWSVKLSHDFPDRVFTVSFPEGPFDDLIDYQLTFFQENHE